MDSYVVYIYRRPDQRGGKLAGLVERIGDGERKAFQSEAQLLEYLSGEKPEHVQSTADRNEPKKPRRR
jgi:predicted Ser/Thr protein kinase